MSAQSVSAYDHDVYDGAEAGSHSYIQCTLDSSFDILPVSI